MICYLRSRAFLHAILSCLISGCFLSRSASFPHDTPKVLDISGREQSLAQYTHTPTLLFLWASWCPECLVELDNLDTVKEKLKGYNVEIVAVAISDSLESVLSIPPVRRAPYL